MRSHNPRSTQPQQEVIRAECFLKSLRLVRASLRPDVNYLKLVSVTISERIQTNLQVATNGGCYTERNLD
jgi:hypothetical protein